jgi:cytochrome c peroxidase
MNRAKFIVALLFACMLASFKIQNENLFHVPKNWPPPHYDFKKNPLSAEKIFLGRLLFYDPLLSQDNSISCASCHSPYNAFAHVDHALSHGINDRIGQRNAPALMNLAWHSSFMLDGAINHLDMQSLFPITHPDEMAETMDNVIHKLQRDNRYPVLFKNAFGDSSITGEKTLKAISQFMLTLVTYQSKYDSVMNQQSEFSQQEKQGYELFKKHCSSCHTEPLFTNLSFENNGLLPDPNLKDGGRIRVTKNAKDSLKFKVPSLRNIEFSYPYMHDGRFKKLSEVINHYTHGISNSATLAEALKTPIVLNSNQKVDLIAFLLTLSDKKFLFNPAYSYAEKR